MAANIIKFIVYNAVLLNICINIALLSLLRARSEAKYHNLHNDNQKEHDAISHNSLPITSRLQMNKLVESKSVDFHQTGFADEITYLGNNGRFESGFRSLLTDDQRNQLLEMLRVFSHEMKSNNVTYFLYSGSLLGSWRHHGFIPWDDDLDVIVDGSQKPKVKVITNYLQHIESVHAINKESVSLEGLGTLVIYARVMRGK